MPVHCIATSLYAAQLFSQSAKRCRSAVKHSNLHTGPDLAGPLRSASDCQCRSRTHRDELLLALGRRIVVVARILSVLRVHKFFSAAISSPGELRSVQPGAKGLKISPTGSKRRSYRPHLPPTSDRQFRSHVFIRAISAQENRL